MGPFNLDQNEIANPAADHGIPRIGGGQVSQQTVNLSRGMARGGVAPPPNTYNVPQQTVAQAQQFSPAQQQAGTQAIQEYVNQQGQFADAQMQRAQELYDQISISLNPDTLQIDVQAPDYYLESTEFQEQILPQIQRLEGQDLLSAEASPIFSDEFQDQVRQQAAAIGERQNIIQGYLEENPQASQDDAMVFYRNSAAAFEEDDDDNALLVLPNVRDTTVGVRAPGQTGETMSVREMMDMLSGESDMFRLNFFQNLNRVAEDPNQNSTNRAAAQGVINFMQGKGLLQAGEDTQGRVAGQDFIESVRSTLPGAVGGALADITVGADTREAAQQYREATDELRALEGAEQQSQALAPFRTAMEIGTDLATAGLGAGVARGAVGAIARAGAAGRLGQTGVQAATRIGQAGEDIARIGQAGLPGRLVAGGAVEAPFNLSYGVQEALTNVINNADQEDLIGNFVDDTLISAGTFGIIGAAGRALRGVDTASSGRLYRASQDVGRAIGRVADVVTKVPGLKALTKNTINRNAAFTRSVDRAFNRGQIDDTTYYQAWNDVNLFNQRGSGLASDVERTSDAFKASAAVNQLLTPEEAQVAANWNNAYQQLTNAQRGAYGDVSPQRIDDLNTEVNELSSELDQIAQTAASEGRAFDAQGYRQNLVRFNEDINQFMAQNGLTNNDLNQLLQENGALSGDYTYIQFETDNAQQFFRGQKNRLTTRDPQERLRGLTQREAIDPLIAARQKLHAAAERAATNRIDQWIVRGIDEGWIQGRVLQTPGEAGRLRELQIRTADRNQRVVPEMERMVNELSDDIPNLRDEIINAGGDADIAAKTFNDTIRQKVDEAAQRLLEDNVISRQIDEYIEEVPTATREQVAYEMLDTARGEVNNMVDTAFARTRLDAAEQDDLKEAVRTAIEEETTKAIAQSGEAVGTADIFNELKSLNRSLSGRTTDSDFSRPFFSGGNKGYYEVSDPDLADFLQQSNSPAETGMIQRFIEGASRTFRLGTTAANPAYAFGVAPVRDSVQAAVLSGTGVFNPTYLRRTLLEQMGGDEQAVDALMRQLDIALDRGTFQDMARGQEQIARTARQRKMADRNERRELERSLRGWGERRGSIKETTLNTADMISSPQKVLDSLRNPGAIARQVEDVMNIPELRMRERVYTTRFQAAKDRGLSDEAAQAEALFHATNSMVMFSNIGEKMQRLVRTIPYLNASIQGIASFNRLWRLDPIGVSARLMSGIVTPVAYLTVANMTDPEKVETYYNVPRYERESNFIVVLDDGAIVKIPMGYELASLVNPIRETIEAMHGLGEVDLLGSLARGMSIASPIDVGGFIPSGEPGDDAGLFRGAERLVSSLLPPAAGTGIEAFTGRSAFTGAPIGPTEEELIERGQVEPGEDITAGDITFSSRDSQTLRALADATGVPQANLQSFVRSAGGELGQMVLGGVDRLFGAPEEEQGGRGFLESFSRRFFNKDPNQTDRDFNQVVSDLEGKRDELNTRLERLGRNSRESGEPSAIAANEEMRENLIQQYASDVAAAADEYGQYYERVGGMNTSQKRRVANLMNIISDDQMTFAPESQERDTAQQQFFDARQEGQARGTAAGLQPFEDRDVFGTLQRREGGGVQLDTSDTFFVNQEIRDTVLGAPRRAVFEFENIMEGDDELGVESMKSVRDKFYDRINAIYDRGDLGPADYDEIESLQRAYMEQFDARMEPLLQKYGTAILNNNNVINEMRGMVMIPRADWAEGVGTSRSGRQFQKFISSRVFPNAGPDVKDILQQRYQLSAEAAGLESDEQVRDRVEQINDRLRQGQRSAAASIADDLQRRIQQGNLFADATDMQAITSALR